MKSNGSILLNSFFTQAMSRYKKKCNKMLQHVDIKISMKVSHDVVNHMMLLIT